ncbi:Glutamine synthetase [Venturia inaequalis]|uniref:NB-ARC domain-containing protein n=1 Tax=Venturia inaequalis TaxID=5025 RepID=A0A8H3Z3S3_VENIN|nr:hypothetical protein EG327_005220 [Venturia inaequalis]RDI80258.1 Glutamine synthetase [Venturia inaequalis]
MEPLNIQKLASKCAASFKARFQDQPLDLREEESEERDLLETQNARFNLWADNIGVFAEGNASLDARLQEHQDIALLVMGQLLSVQRHLGRMATYKWSDDDYDEIYAAEQRCHDDYSSTAQSQSSYSFSDSATESQESITGSAKEAVEETTPLVAIIIAIHRLHRVAMAIRKSGAEYHEMKAAVEQFFDEEGTDAVDVFERWCLGLLRYKFKTADESTLKRIAHNNGERRRRFLYRKKHQKKLAGRRDSGASPQELSSPISVLHADTSTSPLGESGPGKRPVGHLTAPASTAQMTQTTASRLVRDKYHYEQSVAPSTPRSIAPSTLIHFDSTMYPPAPKVPTGAQEFYCPYCCKVQPSSERSGKHWKQHFLKDLSPFVCFVEGCQERDKLFPDQGIWLKHVESHSIKFTCQQHPKSIQFDTELDFNNHILGAHRQLGSAHLDRLRSFNSTSARLDICNCPICGFVPTKAKVPGQSVAKDEPAYNELLAHIASDLHWVAMWSLDECDDAGVDIDSNASDNRVADESTLAAGLSDAGFDLDWRKNDMDDDWSTGERPTTAGESMDEVVPEGADLHDEWANMVSKKAPYTGHERDKTLRNFVRRLQLEKLLEEGKTADPQLPCHYMPIRAKRDFYGRDELLQSMERSLHPATATKLLRTLTLTGPAGIGKTQLAVQYCEDYRNQYDVVLWVHADEESKMANDFVKIAAELGFVGKDSAESRDLEHCRQLVRAWLDRPLKNLGDSENPEVATWLLVFDHIIDHSLVNEYWPTNARSGSILITSRKAMPWSSTYYPVLQVEPFDSKDSAAFLIRSIQNADIKNGGLRLGSSAAHSPTQLIFLARMIDLGRYSLDQFVKASEVDDGKQAILLLHAEDATKNQTDFSEWALESLSPKAAALLDAMAMMDPDQIAERTLVQPPDSIMIPAYPKSMEDYIAARNELLSFSFIARDRMTGNMTIHRMIQDAARGNMSEKRFRDVFNSCIALINDQWPYQAFTWRHSISRWARCEELYTHIVRLQYFSARAPTSEEDIDGAYGHARLATDVAWYCHERGRGPESEEFCNSALAICEILRPFLKQNAAHSKLVDVVQIDRTIAEIHHNHGCINAEMNRPQDALRHQLIFNNMMQKELAGKQGSDMRLAMSYNELGVAHMINESWVEGEDCFKMSIQEMKLLDNYKKYKISLPLVNLASCHYLNGDYVKAEELLLEGLADRVEEFGIDDRESFITGRFYHGLAHIKRGLGSEKEAFEFLLKARDHYQKTLGRGHHRSADVAVALGRHYRRIAQYDTAYEHLTRALEAYEGRSIYTPEKARAFCNRAKSLRRLGRHAEAEEDENESLELYRGLVPDDTRPFSELSDGDFEKLIVFWSR